MNVIGDVAGRTCIMQDDIIDTAGTITKAASALKENGAARVIRVRGSRRVVGTRRSSGSKKSPIDKLIVTNTIPHVAGGRDVPVRSCVLSVARLLGQAIRAFTKRRRCHRCLCSESQTGLH